MKALGVILILCGLMALGLSFHSRSTGHTVAREDGPISEVKRGSPEFDKEVRNETLCGVVCLGLGVLLGAFSGKEKDEKAQ
jgi:hypothetical protein